MDCFNPIVLFSEVHGRVFDGGRPVEGVKVVQRMIWSDDDSKNVVRHVMTASDGSFHFDAIVRKAGLRRISLSQPAMSEYISLEYEGRNYVAWKAGKITFEPNSELGGRPMDLVCDLSRPARPGDGYYGICIAR